MELLKRVPELIPFLEPYPIWVKVCVSLWAFATTGLLLLLVLVPRTITPPTRGRLFGAIDSAPQAPVANAAIELLIGTSSPILGTTDSEGRFDLDLASVTIPTTARLRASASGFRTYERNLRLEGVSTDVGTVRLQRDGSSPSQGAAQPEPIAPQRPLTRDALTIDERQLLEEIQAGKYVDIRLESFFPLAVLSGQVTESELDTFLNRAMVLLKSSTDYYATGEQDAITVGAHWQLFIWRTYNPQVFKKTQDGVLNVIEYLLTLRRGPAVMPPELVGVSVTVRGKGRFFDLEGIPGSGQRTWVGFDLR